MEKFSAYRDPGTGIQPFLKPVPPLGPDWAAKVTLPLRYILGIVRFLAILLLTLVYVLLANIVGPILFPVKWLFHSFEHLVLKLIGFPILFLVGVYRIPFDQASRKRGKSARSQESWNPKAGDIIVSNWVSWVEILWLGIWFNPAFVVPIPGAVPIAEQPSSSKPVAHTPGRRTGTGSANIQSPTRRPAEQIPIVGFQELSLISMIRLTGHVSSFNSNARSNPQSLDEIQKSSTRPLVIFPECTTSNGRGILRFSNIFSKTSVPVKGFKVFIMCIRYDPPTSLSPSASLPIPCQTLNPLPHIFSLTTSLSVSPITIRVLPLSESPSSPLFMASDILTGPSGTDQLSEVCASLMGQIGKLKRVGMGWEDKSTFLEFYASRNR